MQYNINNVYFQVRPLPHCLQTHGYNTRYRRATEKIPHTDLR